MEPSDTIENTPSIPFVHLHLHTQYSLLDGANRLEDLVARAREFSMPAMAITDHGNMFSAVEFYLKSRNAASPTPASRRSRVSRPRWIGGTMLKGWSRLRKRFSTTLARTSSRRK